MVHCPNFLADLVLDPQGPKYPNTRHLPKTIVTIPYKNPKGALYLVLWTLGVSRGPKGHVNMRISHPGSKAQYEGDTNNHGL